MLNEIKVAEGTYTGINNKGGHAQVVYIDKSITIRGGYTTTNWTTSDPVANPTTLDAEGGGRVLYITGNINPTIEGLRITGGDATVLGSDEDGGGVFVQFATATFMNNQVFSNTAHVGGGFNLDQSAATLSHNTIISNNAGHGGGGLWMWQCDNTTLSGNTISFNTASSQAGGLWSGGASDNVIFDSNTFSNNYSGGFAGGLELQGEGYSLIGNTIISNTATHGGGGLFLLNGDFTLTGNTKIDCPTFFEYLLLEYGNVGTASHNADFIIEFFYFLENSIEAPIISRNHAHPEQVRLEGINFLPQMLPLITKIHIKDVVFDAMFLQRLSQVAQT